MMITSLKAWEGLLPKCQKQGPTNFKKVPAGTLLVTVVFHRPFRASENKFLGLCPKLSVGSVKIAKLFTENTHAGGHFSHHDDMFNYFLAIFCVEGEKRKSLFLYQFIQCNIINIRMLCKSTANISTDDLQHQYGCDSKTVSLTQDSYCSKL